MERRKSAVIIKDVYLSHLKLLKTENCYKS